MPTVLAGLALCVALAVRLSRYWHQRRRASHSRTRALTLRTSPAATPDFAHEPAFLGDSLGTTEVASAAGQAGVSAGIYTSPDPYAAAYAPLSPPPPKRPTSIRRSFLPRMEPEPPFMPVLPPSVYSGPPPLIRPMASFGASSFADHRLTTKSSRSLTPSQSVSNVGSASVYSAPPPLQRPGPAVTRSF